MSSTPVGTPPTAPPSTLPPLPPTTRREITLVSHSMLFYWWPIWVLGYILALITLYENHRLAIVPEGAKLIAVPEGSKLIAPEGAKLNVKDLPGDGKSATFLLEVPKPVTKSLDHAVQATQSGETEDAFRPHMSQRSWMGPVFCVVLLITVVITNVPLRGLWSFLVLLVIAILVLIISVLHGWDSISKALFNLHIYINMAGYLFIATAVFILWAVSVFIFDQRTYMTVEPGQIRICEHIGASIRNIDATGVEFEKQRDDLFRHWLLGFFSGDLIIHLPDRTQVRLPNVLGIGFRMNAVQQLLREKAVTPM